MKPKCETPLMRKKNRPVIPDIIHRNFKGRNGWTYVVKAFSYAFKLTSFLKRPYYQYGQF